MATNTEIVKSLYEAIGQSPDEAGLAYWIKQLDDGNLDKTTLPTAFYTAVKQIGTPQQTKIAETVLSGGKSNDKAMSGVGLNSYGARADELYFKQLEEGTALYNKQTGQNLTTLEFDKLLNPTTYMSRWGNDGTPQKISNPTPAKSNANLYKQFYPENLPIMQGKDWNKGGLASLTPEQRALGYVDPWQVFHSGTDLGNGQVWFANPTANKQGTAETYYRFANSPDELIAGITSPNDSSKAAYDWMMANVKQNVMNNGQAGFTVAKENVPDLYGAFVQDRRDNEKFAKKDGWNIMDTLALAALVYGGYNFFSGGSGGLFGSGGTSSIGLPNLATVGTAGAPTAESLMSLLPEIGAGSSISLPTLTSIAGSGISVESLMSTLPNLAGVTITDAAGGVLGTLNSAGQIINGGKIVADLAGGDVGGSGGGDILESIFGGGTGGKATDWSSIFNGLTGLYNQQNYAKDQADLAKYTLENADPYRPYIKDSVIPFMKGLQGRSNEQYTNQQGLFGKLAQTYTDPLSIYNTSEMTALNDIFRQQIERRDAAAGRNSQYGARAVEMQNNFLANALPQYRSGLTDLFGKTATNAVDFAKLSIPGSAGTAGSDNFANLMSGSNYAANNWAAPLAAIFSGIKK